MTRRAPPRARHSYLGPALPQCQSRPHRHTCGDLDLFESERQPRLLRQCPILREVDASISIDRIREATTVIHPAFLHTPQFDCEPLSKRLGVSTVLKVESVNPIRSFKGRGTDYLLHRLREEGDDERAGLVCASAGNFGQGMAFACRKRDRPLTCSKIWRTDRGNCSSSRYFSAPA